MPPREFKKTIPVSSKLYAYTADASKSVNSASDTIEFGNEAYGLEILDGDATLVEVRDSWDNDLYLGYDDEQKLIPMQIKSIKIPAGSNAVIRIYFHAQ